MYDTSPQQNLLTQCSNTLIKIATLGCCGNYTFEKGLAELLRKITELKLRNNIKITIIDDCGGCTTECPESIVFHADIQPLIQQLQRLQLVDLRGKQIRCSDRSFSSIYTVLSNVPLLILRFYNFRHDQLNELRQKMPQTKIYIQENRRVSLIN